MIFMFGFAINHLGNLRMNLYKTALAGLAAVLMSGAASASPFTLSYDVTANGGGWDYDFNLILDNNDSSFVAGQNFDWFVVGDAFSSASPFTEGNAFFTSTPSGWLATASAGGHNGPTLCFLPSCGNPGWVPTLGDTLAFSGFSNTYVAEGDLLWSNLSGPNQTSFEAAVLSSVPLPAGLPLLASGALLLGFVRRRKTA